MKTRFVSPILVATLSLPLGLLLLGCNEGKDEHEGARPPPAALSCMR